MADALVWKEITEQLIHPVDASDGNRVTALIFREPDAAAMEAWDDAGFGALGDDQKPTVRQAIVLMQSMLKFPSDPEIIRRLHRDDFVRLTEVLTPLATGSKPSAASAPLTPSSPKSPTS